MSSCSVLHGCSTRSRVLAIAVATTMLVSLLGTPLCSAGVEWTKNGVELRGAGISGDADYPQIISDGSGGAIVTWQEGRAVTGKDIYAQRVLAGGVVDPAWPANGTAICAAGNAQQYPEITSDGAGGAIITWADERWGVNVDIYAQHVLSTGIVDPGWPAWGRVICDTGDDLRYPRIASDGSGGAIITWYDNRSGSQYDIYAQRVLASGTVDPAWPANGRELRGTGVTGSSVDPRIISDGSGGAIVAWEDARSGTASEIYAQKVNASGAVQWAVNGIELRGTGVAGYATHQEITFDGAGGAIVAWEDRRSSIAGIYAQRALSNGTADPAWPADGMALLVAGGTGGGEPKITSDEAGGAVVAWYDSRRGVGKTDIYAQRVNASGTVRWTVNGVKLRGEGATGDAWYQEIAPDGSGGAVATWLDTRSGQNDIYAQRVDFTGTVRWTANGVELRGDGLTENAYDPAITSDGSEGAIVTWRDDRDNQGDIYVQGVTNDPLTVTSLSPSSGTRGTTVSVTSLAGTGFYGSPAVKLKRSGQSDIAATDVTLVSTNRITCRFRLPANAAVGKWNICVRNPNGQSATKTDAFNVVAPPVPNGKYAWYLAEGTTAWGFSTYITVQNPNSSPANVKFTYMTDDGPVDGGTYAMPETSQLTVNPAEELGAKDFSTKVECLEGMQIAVDRTMTWNAGAGEEAHNSVGVTAPAKTWYLAEGSSGWGFECWLLIQNPNTSAANCTITYMIEGEGPREVPVTVPPSSRATYSMADHIGAKDASIKVESDRPVIPERAMYRNSRRGGHDSIGTTAPATDYYLAEGACGYDVGYITYVLVQNPQSTPTDVSLAYMTQAGEVAGPSFQMPANSRNTIRVNDQLDPYTDVSTHVHGSAPIIAERAMYWDNGTGEACHDSIGMDSPHATFYLPDGETSNGRETWTLVQNPNDTPVEVEITYMTPEGTGNVTKTESIPAGSRRTFNMAEHSGLQGRASIMVRSKTPARKIMVERAMYWNSRGAGTDTIGGCWD